MGFMNPVFFFELSGELERMPLAEAIRCIEAECDNYEIIASGPGYLMASFPKDNLSDISNRLALTHSIGRHLCSFDPNQIPSMDNIEIPAGSFAIRAKRFEGLMKDVDSQDLIKKFGNILSKNNDVDLKNPEVIIRMQMCDRVHIYLEEKIIEKNLLEKRKVGERPFFSPISIHPKYARALINLTGVKKGGFVLDPFCGTGGIMIEAAEMGMKAIASDFDEEMVIGCQENMDFYNLKLHDFDIIDIDEIPNRFQNIDVVATDPPYGRSTKTGGEDVEKIYHRALASIPNVLNSEGKAGIVFPLEVLDSSMNLENVYRQHVHGSLSRHYHIFNRSQH